MTGDRTLAKLRPVTSIRGHGSAENQGFGSPLDYVYKTHDGVQAKNLTDCTVKAEYPDVFQSLGRLKDSYSMEIDESVRRVVHAPGRVPVPVREKET